jgi:hypothetical protein
MKNIYELFNDMDIDENEFVEMEVNELDRAKVKRALKESINRKKKIWKRSVAAAVIIVVLSATTFGVTFPAYASSIPVIGDIFRFLDIGRTGLYDDYKEYSSVINTTKESNGIKVTINDAIFDGETVSVAYSLESDQDLGDTPYLFTFLDIIGSNGVAGGNQISKVDENNYVGLMTATGFNRKEKDTVNIKWNIESITNQDSKENITGNWDFALALKATESNTQLIDLSAEHGGVIVHIGEISVTPMSFIVNYDQVVTENIRNKWDMVDVDLEIKDDLGNSYSGKGNGGSGDKEGYKMSWSKTFEKLDQNATKLIITPHLALYEYTSDNHGSVEMTKDGSKEIPVPKKSGKGKEEFILEDIIIELKK